MPSRWGGSVFPDAADAVPQLGQCIFWESAAEDSQTGDAPRKAQSGAVTQEARTEDTSRKPPSDVMAQARSEDTSRKPSPDVMAQARTEDTSRKTSSDVMAQEARSGTTASERSRTCKFSGGQHT